MNRLDILKGKQARKALTAGVAILMMSCSSSPGEKIVGLYEEAVTKVEAARSIDELEKIDMKLMDEIEDQQDKMDDELKEWRETDPHFVLDKEIQEQKEKFERTCTKKIERLTRNFD